MEDLARSTEQPLAVFGPAFHTPAAADPLAYAELARMCLCKDPGDRASFAVLKEWADSGCGLIHSGAAWPQTRHATGTASSSKDSVSAASNSSKEGRTSGGTTSAASSTGESSRGVASQESTSAASSSSKEGYGESASAVNNGGDVAGRRGSTCNTRSNNEQVGATGADSEHGRAAAGGASPTMANLLLARYANDPEKAMELLGAWGNSSNESDASFRSYSRLDGST